MPNTSSSAPHPPSSRIEDTIAESEKSANPPPESTDHAQPAQELPREYGGRKGPDPVRYGDWEKNGRCIDF